MTSLFGSNQSRKYLSKEHFRRDHPLKNRLDLEEPLLRKKTKPNQTNKDKSWWKNISCLWKCCPSTSEKEKPSLSNSDKNKKRLVSL
ncbi:MAG: hypothetical protein ACD_60C00015G0025 [uncultured bacterium]|nr:MAG: hypothetical protein ACD_60C00015G0025 [uncultured bacterium]